MRALGFFIIKFQAPNHNILNPKSEIRNNDINSSYQMTKTPLKYDLEDRTLDFARRIRTFIKKLSRTIGNIEDGKQLVRCSGSVGANYIEANEALGKKDFMMRIRISRKEAK